jgi:hypothetical protein
MAYAPELNRILADVEWTALSHMLTTLTDANELLNMLNALTHLSTQPGNHRGMISSGTVARIMMWCYRGLPDEYLLSASRSLLHVSKGSYVGLLSQSLRQELVQLASDTKITDRRIRSNLEDAAASVLAFTTVKCAGSLHVIKGAGFDIARFLVAVTTHKSEVSEGVIRLVYQLTELHDNHSALLQTGIFKQMISQVFRESSSTLLGGFRQCMFNMMANPLAAPYVYDYYIFLQSADARSNRENAGFAALLLAAKETVADLDSDFLPVDSPERTKRSSATVVFEQSGAEFFHMWEARLQAKRTAEIGGDQDLANQLADHRRMHTVC